MTRVASPKVGIAALALLATVVGGVVVGVGLRGSSSPPATRTVTVASRPAGALAVGDLRVKLPAGWERDPTPLAVPGLGPRSIGLTTTEGSAVLAQVVPADRSLLPAALLHALGREGSDLATASTQTTIGPLRLVSYAVTVPALLRVYVLPTTRGVVLLACPSDFATCPDLLTSVTVNDGRILGPTADAPLRAGLPDAIATLSAARTAQRTALADARTPAARAAAATALAEAYRTAARTVAPLAGGAQSAETVGALRRVWRDYEALATAAGAQDAAAYATAATAVTTDEATVDRLLAAFAVDARS
jgi:hypothetical protein